MKRRPLEIAGNAAGAVLVALAVLSPVQANAQSVDDVAAAQTEADKAAAASQKRINEIVDKTRDAASRYAQAVTDTESLEKYNKHLAEQVKSQEAEIASIERQLIEIETTTREVQPLMERMVATLEQFVSVDVPFLLEERTRRVQSLKDLLARADVSISEKYRRILEAYQIELEYGRTLEAYEGRLGDGPDAKTVDFVRLGRISLMYQTPDGMETGYWDQNKKQWVRDDSYAHRVREALRVARKVGAPDLLTVPVPAPVDVRS